ncbi:MAG: hypothetical protein ACYTFY_12655 [Planctomycetota bacterium]|jgi:hypothetical protein
MRKIIKKSLSILLCVLLVVSLLGAVDAELCFGEDGHISIELDCDYLSYTSSIINYSMKNKNHIGECFDVKPYNKSQAIKCYLKLFLTNVITFCSSNILFTYSLDNPVRYTLQDNFGIGELIKSQRSVIFLN